MPKKDHIVSYTCKRWVVIVVGTVNPRKRGVQGTEGGTDGDITGLVRSGSVRGDTVPRVLGALSLLPVISVEGLLTYVERHSLRPRNGAESPRQG